MGELLYWSDSRQAYFLVAYGGALILCLMAAWPAFHRKQEAKANPVWLYPALLGLWMLAARWPGLFYYLPYDPDEAQIVAAAQTLGIEPVLYLMADGASAGPLVIYFSGVSWLFGLVPSLFQSRLLAVFCAWLGVVAIYAGIRATGFELAARLAALPAALFFGLTSFWNYVHYNSELLPSTLCAWATACLIAMFCQGSLELSRSWVKYACVAGFLLSLVPLAKLQLVPLALCIGILVYVRGAWLLRGHLILLVRYTFLLSLSVLIFPVLFFLLLFSGRAFDYFIHSYVLNNFHYAHSGYADRFYVLGQLLKTGSEMIPWLAGLLSALIVFVAALMLGRKIKNDLTLVTLVCTALAGVSIYCVLAPARDYMHYLLILPLPMSFALGSILAWLLSSCDKPPLDRFIRILAPSALFAAFTPFFIQEVKSGEPWAGSARYWSHKPLTGIDAELKRRATSPRDGLLVWGYLPQLHITTGIIQASRLSVTAGAMQKSPLTEFYGEALMADLVKNRPRFIVDAVVPDGFLYTDHAIYGPHCYPEFAEFLSTYYHQSGKYSGMTIYERNED